MNHGEYTGWRTSSYSSGNGNCVEVARRAARDGRVGVRDSKQHGQGPVLEFTAAQWAAFIQAAKAGRLGA
jgi:hypothetical protein